MNLIILLGIPCAVVGTMVYPVIVNWLDRLRCKFGGR